MLGVPPASGDRMQEATGPSDEFSWCWECHRPRETRPCLLLLAHPRGGPVACWTVGLSQVLQTMSWSWKKAAGRCPSCVAVVRHGWSSGPSLQFKGGGMKAAIGRIDHRESERAVVGKPEHGAIHAFFAARVPDNPTQAHRPRVFVLIGWPTWLGGGPITAI